MKRSFLSISVGGRGHHGNSGLPRRPWAAASAQNTSTANASATPAPALPYGAREVVKMYQGGISKDMIVNYINSTSLPYHLTADGILYLQTLGVPQEATQSHDPARRPVAAAGHAAVSTSNSRWPAAMAAANGAAAAQSPAQVVTPTTPAPSVTVIGGSDYPYDYSDYGYPYYGYGGWPYYGGYGAWPYYGYGGLGWGWGYGGYGYGGYGRYGRYGGYGGFRGGVGGFRGGVGGFRGGVGGFRGGVGGFRGGVGGFRGGVGGFRGGGGFHGGGGGGHGGGGGGGHR